MLIIREKGKIPCFGPFQGPLVPSGDDSGAGTGAKSWPRVQRWPSESLIDFEFADFEHFRFEYFLTVEKACFSRCAPRKDAQCRNVSQESRNMGVDATCAPNLKRIRRGPFWRCFGGNALVRTGDAQGWKFFCGCVEKEPIYKGVGKKSAPKAHPSARCARRKESFWGCFYVFIVIYILYIMLYSTGISKYSRYK